MSKKKTFTKIAIPIIIIVLGVFIMRMMISSRQAPAREVRDDPGILVEVLRAERQDIRVTVRGTGTVEASQEVSIIPQVSGKVASISPSLVVGGFFKKDETLFEIEDIDYRLALEQAESARARAEFDLATIESQARIARTEWEQLNRNDSTPPNPLVLYEPQLRSARAALSSASAQLEQAGINLERTKIKAPFSGRIKSENIDPGQVIQPGSIVAVLSGSDTAEIAVPLPIDELRWISVPGYGERQNGADASVHIDIGNESYEWKGHVVRSSGEIDTSTRMMKIILEVNDPYGLKQNKKSGYAALASGAFVDVHIKGKEIKDVFVIPRSAFRDNATVWIMDKENMLKINKVDVIKIERETVIIGKGLEDGDMVIMTNISGAAEGMKLRMKK
jgi:RND family efflux transporter MFP subunit